MDMKRYANYVTFFVTFKSGSHEKKKNKKLVDAASSEKI
jgi:hypothetical protein